MGIRRASYPTPLGGSHLHYTYEHNCVKYLPRCVFDSIQPVDRLAGGTTISAVKHEQPIADFIAELAPRVRGELRADDMSRALYSSDASLYQLVPHAVLLPRTVDDVQAAVSLAAAHRVPVLARTAGTSLAGQAVNEALVIDFTRHLDAIVEINPAERWVRVQPGVVLDHLNRALRPHGLQFGPDPASSSRACLGGIVAANATGSHSILYGMTADHVSAMDVILSDGRAQRLSAAGPDFDIGRAVATLVADPANAATIRAGTPRHWRRCGGYNLDRLLPEDGTPNLAQLSVRLRGYAGGDDGDHAQSRAGATHTGLALVLFDDAMTALSAVPALLEMNPSAIELLDHLSLSLCREVPEYNRLLRRFLDDAPDCHCLLVVEMQGDSPRQKSRDQYRGPDPFCARGGSGSHGGHRCGDGREASSRLGRAQGGPGPADVHARSPQARAVHRRRCRACG